MYKYTTHIEARKLDAFVTHFPLGNTVIDVYQREVQLRWVALATFGSLSVRDPRIWGYEEEWEVLMSGIHNVKS